MSVTCGHTGITVGSENCLYCRIKKCEGYKEAKNKYKTDSDKKSIKDIEKNNKNLKKMKEIKYIAQITSEDTKATDKLLAELDNTNYLYRRHQYKEDVEIIDIYEYIED